MALPVPGHILIFVLEDDLAGHLADEYGVCSVLLTVDLGGGKPLEVPSIPFEPRIVECLLSWTSSWRLNSTPVLLSLSLRPCTASTKCGKVNASLVDNSRWITLKRWSMMQWVCPTSRKVTCNQQETSGIVDWRTPRLQLKTRNRFLIQHSVICTHRQQKR